MVTMRKISPGPGGIPLMGGADTTPVDTTPSATFHHLATTGDGFNASAVSSTSLDIEISAPGDYIFAVIGSAGRSSSGNQDINVDSVLRGGAAQTYSTIRKNWITTKWENISFYNLTAPSAGTYTVNMSIEEFEIYRVAIVTWKVANLAGMALSYGNRVSGLPTNISVTPDNIVLAAIIGKGAADTRTLTGMATTDVASTLFETTSDFYFGAYSEHTTAVGNLTLTHDSGKTNYDRALMAYIKYAPPT